MSGPKQFGISEPKVMQMLARMPRAKFCENYVPPNGWNSIPTGETVADFIANPVIPAKNTRRPQSQESVEIIAKDVITAKSVKSAI